MAVIQSLNVKTGGLKSRVSLKQAEKIAIDYTLKTLERGENYRDSTRRLH